MHCKVIVSLVSEQDDSITYQLTVLHLVSLRIHFPVVGMFQLTSAGCEERKQAAHRQHGV